VAQFVLVPSQRLAADVLTALLEEYASRDGTDYGVRELSLDEKVDSLRAQLGRDDLGIVYDQDSEQWDLLPREALAQLEL
jgi:uncharacterized protein YheU (UPF0270 family)